jgi:carnitine-CoA ligase
VTLIDSSIAGGVPWKILDVRAQKSPDDEFIQVGSPWYSYGAFAELTSGLAGGLQQLAVAAGDRIAFTAPGCIEYVALQYASAKAGLVQVPINTYLRGEFLRYQLVDCGATVVVTDVHGLTDLTEMASDLPAVRTVILVESDDIPPSPFDVVTYGHLLEAQTPPRLADTHASDLCSILYTSGTTGLSKGCMVSHGYAANMAVPFIDAGWFRSGDRMLTPFPLFHGGGQSTVLIALMAGGSVSIERQFSAGSFMRYARDIGATTLYGVGAMGMAILAQPVTDGERDHHVRLALWVPMEAAAQRRFAERFGMPVVAEIYAQTECLPVAISPFSDDRKPGTAGQPCRHVDVMLVDDDDHEVAVGEVGEITVRPRRPDAMFSGYWNNPQATVEAWRNLRHHTGDYARLAAEGYLRFVDRKKDAIRRRGENVSSVEVEMSILKHPAVAAVAVHAVPSELGEDDIKACVVGIPDATFTPENMFEFFKRQLPYFAVPRYVEIVDELPVNAVGRVLKHQLRARGVSATTWDFHTLGLAIAKSERRSRASIPSALSPGREKEQP